MANQLDPKVVETTNREIIESLQPEYIESYNIVLNNFAGTFASIIDLVDLPQEKNAVDGALRRIVGGAVMYAFEAGRDKERYGFLGGDQ